MSTPFRVTDVADHADPNYTAPYEAWPETIAAPDCYYLNFNEGYQIQCFVWLDFDEDEPAIEHTGRTAARLACAITKDQLQRIRHYPGVAKVTQFGDNKWLCERQVRWHPENKFGGRHRLDVVFADKTYTVGEHLKKMGQPLTEDQRAARTGSYGPGRPFSEELLRAIHSDPKVLMIEETSGGQFHAIFPPTDVKGLDETTGYDLSYTAPYEPWLGVSAAPDCYTLSFVDGFQVVNSGYLDYDADDPWIVHTGRTNRERACALTTEQREHIRHYPGVAKVKQFGDAEWLRSRKVAMYPERGYGDRTSRVVIFSERSYTAGEHFTKIGQVIERVSPRRARMYVAGPLSDKQVRAIFSDPKVLCIDQSTPGKFH